MLVAVQLSVLGLYLPPVSRPLLAISGSAADDLFAAGPHCRGKHSAIGRVRDAG